jgi:hypothetical protein
MIINYGNRLLIINIILMSLIFSPALLLVLLLFGKEFFGLLRLQRLGTSGKLEMVKGLSSGKISGLEPLV